MKHIFTAVLAIAVLSLSSCGVTTKVTYGDISVLNYDGTVIRQWDNATMDVVVTDNYSGEKLYRSYAIKDGGGLSFVDKTGESHYVSGGIIIVDNISTSYTYTQEDKEETNKEQLLTEYKQLKEKYNQNKKLIKTHKRGGRGPGRVPEEQYDRYVKENENIAKRMKELEKILQEYWNDQSYD